MRACSFVPAATHMVYDLGLEEHLVGVTFECPSDRPKIVRSRLEGRSLTSAEIDRIVSETQAAGESLYYVEQALLESSAPELVFTQHVCDVCQIGTSYVERAVASLTRTPRIVPLVPRRLPDVFDNALTIANELLAPERGTAHVAEGEARLQAITDALAAKHVAPARVMVMEWLDPVYNCGHWIPDQIERAGGRDPLGVQGGYSVPTAWEDVRRVDPEVLVVAPCGFDVARTLEELARLRERPGYGELAAVRNGRVYAAHAELFTQPSLSTLVLGIELLAHLFHPALFAAPQAAAGMFAPLKD